MNNNHLGHNLKVLRKESKLSQSKLGEILGVSGAYIQQIEKGIKTNPSIDLIYKISSYFDIAPLFLLEHNIDDEFLDFAEVNELSSSLRKQAIKKDELYNTDKYFKKLFKKPSELEENSVSQAIKVLLKKLGYNLNSLTIKEYEKIEESTLNHLKAMIEFKQIK